MNRQTVTAIIASDAQDIKAYFAWSPTTKLRSLLVDYIFCPKDTCMLGKWVEMVIDDRDRSRGPVRIIPDVFETRLISTFVEVRVDFQHDGRFESKFEMFYNDYFGYICDPKYVISRVDQGAWYNGWIVRHKEDDVNSRWRLSVRQEISKVIKEKPKTDASDPNFQVVCAVVRSYARSGGSYFAWSKSRPKSTIRIDFSFCDPSVELLGKWVEVSIDEKNRVQKPVTIIDDFFKTWKKGRSIEIFVSFEQIDDNSQRSNNQDYMFFNDFFGCIRDEMCVVDDVEKNGRYHGWIEYDQPDEESVRWRVAMGQTVTRQEIEPNRYRSRSPIHAESTQHRNDSRFVSSALISEGVSGVNTSLPNSQDLYFMDGRSPENNRRSRCASPEFLSNNENERSPSYKQQNVDHDKSYRQKEERFPDSTSPRFNASFRSSKFRDDKEEELFQTNELYDKEDDVIHRLPREESNTNEENFYDEPFISPRNLGKPTGLPTNTASTSQPSSDLKQRQALKTDERDKLMELQMKFDRISDIFAFFNSNKAISQSLRRMDIEQYDELIDLLKTND